ncbi:protein-L-isoaspartate(D-aspartate) O-methyltransferase [Thermoclostridium stercorarium]|uniref:protein-L-isoaspartate(D-aspartate) O-methyltransferase n=1 Tax=Thermoclostridium stercorarium TaxID=1510 RepID=UPI0023B802FA|nr:protein-L-isoaspartate(D-aspartate) O-methyltransferase [Thermoclostridium stercorarium]
MERTSFFVDDDMKKYAHLDEPLPIGFGQTISQPSLVLEMTRLLSPEKDGKVLEIGTGSGFQTAILAKMSAEVFTVERIPELMEKARERLETLNFTNVRYKVGDGSLGWPEYAPYDRIMVTAAACALPDELVEQLANGGRMVIPIGPPDLQELKLITKTGNGDIRITTVEFVRFVELKGKYGWK